METKFENLDFTESSNDDDSSLAPLTPYLLFYSDVLKELNSKKDAVDIAKEAKERWSKMTPRSLQYYIEMVSNLKTDEVPQQEYQEPLEFQSKININDETNFELTKNKISKKRAQLSSKKLPKPRNAKKNESENILRSSGSLAKRPIKNWENMVNWVTSSRMLRYKGKYAKSKSKSCKRRKSRKLKKKIKKGIKKRGSKCKNSRCETIKGRCSCHRTEKNKSSNLGEKPSQGNKSDENKLEENDG